MSHYFRINKPIFIKIRNANYSYSFINKICAFKCKSTVSKSNILEPYPLPWIGNIKRDLIRQRPYFTADFLIRSIIGRIATERYAKVMQIEGKLYYIVYCPFEIYHNWPSVDKEVACKSECVIKNKEATWQGGFFDKGFVADDTFLCTWFLTIPMIICHTSVTT